jgi:hypothetical protein
MLTFPDVCSRMLTYGSVGNASDVCSSAGGAEMPSCASANANASARNAAESEGTKRNAQVSSVRPHTRAADGPIHA